MKKSEFGRISEELSVDTFDSIEKALTSNYYFGFAVALSQLRIIAQEHSEPLSEEIVETLVNHYAEMDDRVRGYYDRLKKDL